MKEKSPPCLCIKLGPEAETPKVIIDASVLPDGSILQLISSNGFLVELVTDNKGGHLGIWDSKGQPRITLGIDDGNHSSLFIEDQNGKRVIFITSDPTKPALTVYKNNKPVLEV